jgi:hypothetical protein
VQEQYQYQQTAQFFHPHHIPYALDAHSIYEKEGLLYGNLSPLSFPLA